MNFGILIETNEPEKAWNGVRFANASLKAGHAVRIFLMSAGVEIEHITHEKFNVQVQLQEFAQLGGKVDCSAPANADVKFPQLRFVPYHP